MCCQLINIFAGCDGGRNGAIDSTRTCYEGQGIDGSLAYRNTGIDSTARERRPYHIGGGRYITRAKNLEVKSVDVMMAQGPCILHCPRFLEVIRIMCKSDRPFGRGKVNQPYMSDGNNRLDSFK